MGIRSGRSRALEVVDHYTHMMKLHAQHGVRHRH